jgi:hypothetical protein
MPLAAARATLSICGRLSRACRSVPQQSTWFTRLGSNRQRQEERRRGIVKNGYYDAHGQDVGSSPSRSSLRAQSPTTVPPAPSSGRQPLKCLVTSALMRYRCRWRRTTPGSHTFMFGTHTNFTKNASGTAWRSGTGSRTSPGGCASLLSSRRMVTGSCLARGCLFRMLARVSCADARSLRPELTPVWTSLLDRSDKISSFRPHKRRL